MDSFGAGGTVYRDTEIENVDLETVSADIAAEIQMRCDIGGAPVPDFVRTHTPSTNAPVGSSACLRAKSSVGIKARFPGSIEPERATSIEKPPKGARWIHEIKFDGYRVQVHMATCCFIPPESVCGCASANFLRPTFTVNSLVRSMISDGDHRPTFCMGYATF
jgi:hypothetical protein